MAYWEEFKRTYPVGMFAVALDRKLLEWNNTFVNLVNWNDILFRIFRQTKRDNTTWTQKKTFAILIW